MSKADIDRILTSVILLAAKTLLDEIFLPVAVAGGRIRAAELESTGYWLGWTVLNEATVVRTGEKPSVVVLVGNTVSNVEGRVPLARLDDHVLGAGVTRG